MFLRRATAAYLDATFGAGGYSASDSWRRELRASPSTATTPRSPRGAGWSRNSAAGRHAR